MLTASEIRVTSEQQYGSSAIEDERKTFTVLFAAIKGSTELMEDLDREEARAIVDPAIKLMIYAIQGYNGHVVQSTGDDIFALFGAPLTNENHPQRAIYAALRMQDANRAYSLKSVTHGGAPVNLVDALVHASHGAASQHFSGISPSQS